MSIARHHAEWLSLVPVSGPFLSLPVLMNAFPQGLDAHDTDHARLLRLAYEEWDDGFQKKSIDPSVHDAWIRFVLTKTLDFDDTLLAEGQAIPQTLHIEVPEHGELLKPDIVLNDPATKKARMLIKKYPRTQDLTSYVAGSRWKASPDTRMTDLLHATGVRLGLVTNGEHWMLVDAPKGETTGYASWYASLWREEKITLQAFRTLLSMTRFFGVSDDETIEALLTKSASNQQEVTEQLGLQVLRAVEVLIQSLDKADQDHGRELLEGVSEAVLYESALNVMMRLVFLFCAEERELIPTKPFPVYEQNYSVSMISKQLREIADQHTEELLERRYDAWPRLLSAFRAVYGGLAHDDIYMPAYGGRLFDPDRFPFLEGRMQKTSWQDTGATPLPVNNRTVLHLLEALQLLQVKLPGGGAVEARRVSFLALDIEQIGHVYEGLLDHTAKRAVEPMLGLIGKKEPEVSLQILEQEREKGDKSFFDFLKGVCGSSRKWEKYLDTELEEQQERRLRTACGNNDKLFERVSPFAGLLRDDTFDYPVVVPKGSVFVTAGTDRRSSGTHYTPRSLTEPIVRYTLEPLVYFGPAEGKPKSEWKLKSAAELLDLKICDMACGSGAFLVQAARYMSERLMEAWDAAKEEFPNVPGITPEGQPSTGKANESLIPEDPAERTTYAMRIVAQRCLYGVDINPLATEMAKLSLWLLTLAKDKPFEFLDHAIRCGDSLVGLNDIEQLRHFSLKPHDLDETMFSGPWLDGVPEAIELRLQLEDMSSNTVEDVEAQEKLLKEAEDKIVRLRCAADILVAGEFWGEGTKDKQEKVRHAAVVARYYVENGPTEEFEKKAAKERRGHKMFHWPLEFPEVIIKRGGFDAFVGNPPFMRGTKIQTNISESYLRGILHIRSEINGNADLCAHFYRVAFSLLNATGVFGLIATNTISQGDTRECGLEVIISKGGTVYRADTSLKWPRLAAVVVSVVHVTRQVWSGLCILDGTSVSFIDTLLSPHASSALPPQRLAVHWTRYHNGSFLNGTGFVIDKHEAEELLQDCSYAEVVRPYIGGRDSYTLTHPNNPERFIIYYGKMQETQAKEWPLAYRILKERVYPERKNHKTMQLREKWWQFKRPTPDLYEDCSGLSRVIVKTQVSQTFAFLFLPSTFIFDQRLIVFPDERASTFSVLQSSIHQVWAERYSATLKNDMSYTPKDCFETFSFPNNVGKTNQVGEEFHQLRSSRMQECAEGLTTLYHRFHDQEKTSPDLKKLRDLHVEIDKAVSAAYTWTDIKLAHDFHETKQGLRFTISEPARREVLQRLLKLNHERYEEEAKQGLHIKKAKRQTTSKAKSKSPSKQAAPMLFDLDAIDSAPELQVTPIVDSISDFRQRVLCGFAVNVFAVGSGWRWNEYADLFAQATVNRATANRFADRLNQAQELRNALPKEFKQAISSAELSCLKEQLLAHDLMAPLSDSESLVQPGPGAASFSLGESLDKALRAYAQLMVGICLKRMDRLPSRREQRVEDVSEIEESAQTRRFKK
jgi:hypothetical protein